MFFIKAAYVVIILNIYCKADWVEIPQMKHSVTVTPVKNFGPVIHQPEPKPTVFIRKGQIESFGSYPDLDNNEDKVKDNNTNIITAAQKSFVKEIFTSTTPFTPLMSSVGVVSNINPTTTPTPNTNRREKDNSSEDRTYEIEVTDDFNEPQSVENNGEYDRVENKMEENTFSTYAGFLPFLKSIQKTLMEKAHKSIKSKIQVLKNLRDNLLYDIDQRLKKLLPMGMDRKQARGYKEHHEEDSHMEFPSNEGALMTIGFLTLAVFLVKLVLEVIHAIKEKKMYYNSSMVSTNTMMNMMTGATQVLSGRKKRSHNPGPDVDTTYRILQLIEQYNFN